MNINQLRYFTTIVECKSFRAASEVLNVSQPALSNSIKTLEDSLQVQLFERGKQGVLPTAYGKVLFHFFRSALQTIERGNHEVELMRDGSKGHINIGAPTGIIDMFLPVIVERVSEIQPGITFGIHYGYLDKLTHSLRHGELDFLLTAYWPQTSLSDDLDIEKLSNLNVSIYARRGHPLHEQEKVTLNDLMKARWMLADSEGMKLFSRQLFGNENTQSVKCVVSHNYPPFMIRMLERSDLLTIIPDYIVSELVESKAIAKIQYPNFSPSLSLGLIKLKDLHVTSSMQLFQDETRNFMKSGMY